MNYQGKRVVGQLRKDNKTIVEKHDKLVLENAQLKSDLQLMQENEESTELLDKLKASGQANESLKLENSDLREKIATLEGKVKKSIDQGPSNINAGPRRGGRGGVK